MTKIMLLNILILVGTIHLIQCQQPSPYPFKNYQRNVQPTTTPQPIDDDEVPLFLDDADGMNNLFEWELSKKVLLSSPGMNTIISPISVKLLLSLLHEGSAGNTTIELSEVLHIPVMRHAVRERTQKILESLKQSSKSEYELMLSTRIFMDKHFEPIQRFSAIAMNFYDTQIQRLDLLSNPQEAVGVLNDWVKNGTKANIKNFITEDDVTNAVLLLMNTIYFKGKWKQQFPETNTKPGDFHVNSRSKISTNFMSNTGLYDYFESTELNAKVIRMPYKGHKFAMYMFLPNTHDNLQELISKLSPGMFKNILWVMDRVKVEVIIPKISFEFTSRLGPILEALGLHNLFQDSVSLPNISRGQNGGLPSLYVSNVLQKSGIEINEEGSTAYTVTAITLGNKFNSADHIFNATQPFVFTIIDENSGNILYFGKIENPLLRTGEIKNVPGWMKPKPQPVSTPIPLPPPAALSANDQNSDEFLNVQQSLFPDEQFLDRINNFDIEILTAMCNGKSGNVLVSPISVKTVLSMILEGCGGETEKELQSALRLPEQAETRRNYMRNTIIRIKDTSSSGVQLLIANGVFYSSAVVPLKSYQDLIKSYYFSEFKPLNFQDTTGTANAINKWVKDQTLGAIEQVITPSSIFPETILAVVNGIYFKGVWEKEFEARDTVDRCFYVTDSQCDEVKMMHLLDVFKYANVPALDAQVVTLPYKGRKYGMMLMVPNKRNGIDQLLRELPFVPLSNLYKSMTDVEVQISMPKFKVDFTGDLVSDLKKMRINKLFSSQAELGQITGTSNNLKVDSVVHKVVLEVNEQGSVAAASTSAMIIPLISSSNPHVRADHPFLIFIHDLQQGNILFSGRISNPKH